MKTRIEHATMDACDTLEQAAIALERAARELRRHKEELMHFDDKFETHVSRSDIMSWATQTVTNIFPNLNLSMFVTRGAELANAERELTK